MDPSRRNKVITKKALPNKKIKERDDEEWNEYSSQEDFECENKKFPLESIPEPEYDEEEVFLSWYDSDLNLIIDDNFTAASPLHQRGFSYLQAGARATFGFFSGKVCFEVKVLQYCKLNRTERHLNTHLLRVGWSPRKASLALGADHKSYGYDSAGRASTIGEIADYGKLFSTGDVVGAFLDIGENDVTISFTVNGEDMGVAYEIPQTVIQKEPLFPHILTKNISYECNFGKENPWFPPKEGYTFVANMGKQCRIAGPRRPKSQSECEVILMVGLPKSGKTAWVNEFREKNPGMYYIIDSNALVDRMELMHSEREAIILRKTRVLGRLLGIAMDRRRNYILDQINIVRAEQVWKLGFFRNYKRRIVSIVLPDEELRKRTNTLDGEDASWMLKLKAKFRLPTMTCPQISEVTDKVQYVGLPLNEALELVKKYNHEAWRRGYKPYKNFRIPPQVFKDMTMTKGGKWMSKGMAGSSNSDFHGSGGWGTPPRARGGGEWPPPRNRSTEEWQPPSRKMNTGEWQSPSRQRMKHKWPSPSRGRSPEQWLEQWPENNNPDDTLISPSRGRTDDGWPSGSRKRRYSESPPRNRPSRWGPREDEHSLPRSRMEEWQSQRARSPGPQNSPPRRRPDISAEYSGHCSPPGRAEELHTGRNRYQAEDVSGGWYPNEGVRPMQGNPEHGNWPLQERFREFPTQEASGRTGSFPQDMQSEGNFHLEQRGSGSRPRCESRLSDSLSPQEANLIGAFPHRGSIMGGRSLSPPQRMDHEFPPQEERLSSNLLHKKERVCDSLYPREERIDPNFSLQDHHLGEVFPDCFPPQDQFGPEHVAFQERGNMRPLENRRDHDFSPRDRKGNNIPTSEHRMVGGLSVHERLGKKIDDMPPQETRPTHSFSSHERMMGDMLPNQDRMHGVTPPGSRMGNFPPHGERIDEMAPHMGRMRGDRIAPAGRLGGNLSSYENRSGDSHSGRIIGNLPPQEHRIGDLPPHEGRMGDCFSPHEGRPRDILPPRESRRGGDFAHREDMAHPFPHLDRFGVNLPSHEGRMASDLLPHERRSGDFPFHEGRIGHGDLQHEREIGDMTYRGIMSGDMPIGGDVGDNIHRGRMIHDMPPLGDRMDGDLPHGRKGGEFSPNSGRIDDLPLGGRIGSGDFLPHGSKITGDLSPSERIVNVYPSHRERIGGDMSPRGGRFGGDLPQHKDRLGGDLPPFRGKSHDDLPIFVGRHEDYSSHGGRPGSDIPRHGRHGGDFPLQGGRFAADMPPHGGEISGDLPPCGGRIGEDVHGDMSREVGMLGDPREGRSSSSDHWNRLLSSSEGPRNFEWSGDQEVSSNKGSIRSFPGNSGHPLPPGRHEGLSGHWKPRNDRLTERASPNQQLQHQLDNRNRDNNANRFHDNERVSPKHEPRQWPSPNRAQRSGSPSPNKQRRQSASPSERSRINQHDLRHNILQPGDRCISPRRPMAGRQLPVNRGDRPPESRHRQLSPDRGWQPPGGRYSGDWPSERENRMGQKDRMPPRSPPWNLQRMETDVDDRPGRPFTEGSDGRDSRGPGYPQMGSIDKKPSGRDLRDKILSGKEQRCPPFNPSNQMETLGPSGSSGVFVKKEEPMDASEAGHWQNPHGAPQEGWQSPGSGGSGSRWERRVLIVKEEEEELAPYEIPFNQADWDSNDPNAGIYYSASGYQPRLTVPDPIEDRRRGSIGSRNQEVGGLSGSKLRGSVWQRVGGYVDDEKEFSSREPHGSSHFSDRGSSRGRGERGHRGIQRDHKERGREFEDSRMRRGRAK